MSAMSGAERQRLWRQRHLDSRREYKNTWEEAFRKLAHENGWETTKRGWPDFLCMSKAGEWFVVEVKPPGKHKSLKSMQVACLDFMSTLGVRCYVFDGEKMHRYVTGSVTARNAQSNVTKKSRNVTHNVTDKELNSLTNPADGPPKRQRRLSIIYSNWTLSLEDRRFAEALGLDPDRTADEFRDYWISEGRVKNNWSAAFRNWCRKAQSFGHSKQQLPPAANGHSPEINEFRAKQLAELARKGIHVLPGSMT